MSQSTVLETQGETAEAEIMAAAPAVEAAPLQGDDPKGDPSAESSRNGSKGHNGHASQDGLGDEMMSFAEMLEEYDTVSPNRGDLLTGHIIRIDKDAIFVDVGAKRDAIVPGSDLGRLDSEMVKNLAAGDELILYVLTTAGDNDDLIVSLSKGLAEQEWTRAEKIMEKDEVVDLEIVGYNTGGILLAFAHLRGFVPNSHVPGLRYLNTDEDRDAFKQQQIGEHATVKIIEVNRERRRLVLSVKAARKEAKVRRMAELEEGSVVTGLVVNLEDYGAFIDLGGVTGLAHISTLDHTRLRHPSQVMSVGDSVEFLIEEVDQERQRIRLNRQALLPNPWEVLINEAKVGDTLTGKVANVVDFGIFVRLPMGVEGLAHISEMPLAPGMKPKDLVKIGEDVSVRILRLEPKRQRVGLSMLPLEPKILWEVADETPAEDEPARDEPVGDQPTGAVAEANLPAEGNPEEPAEVNS